ncbi:MAG: hypothetical protein A3G34_15950 [Candidatus Lindowbacteria bacterium RIFCSPLOWO2_12_FULL_62_27]|nr:MAG: hypothetical protein A3I06_12245 [Candidatus Lindowbacteria bacterium RIFCSPLOWO2_02_FULL_62_12]OGH61654.1 MAG: hypothetical protein A3G34_15950 [Candidatus Lindowbacteria bacterium RIFCSPLOWO2_12_FULL_62_27]
MRFSKPAGICAVFAVAVFCSACGEKAPAPLHERHIRSTNPAYNHENHSCITCHAGFRMAGGDGDQREGYFNEGTVLHPNSFKKTMSRIIVRPRRSEGEPIFTEAVMLRNPHLFKPNLQELVCVKCHGPDSKIKVLYGSPLAKGGNP